MDIINTEDDEREQVVVLVYGDNVFGDQVFAYVKMNIQNAKILKADIESGKQIDVNQYSGEIVAAGRGTPHRDLEEEIIKEYRMLPVSQPEVNNSQPKLWNNDEEF